MTLTFWFWLCMALFVLSGFWTAWRPGPAAGPNYYVVGNNLLLVLLLLILGWHAFGSPIK